MASQPDNPEVAAYAAIALFEALIDILLKRQVIGQEDLNSIGIAASAKLDIANNFGANRAANFVRAWMTIKKEIE